MWRAVLLLVPMLLLAACSNNAPVRQSQKAPELAEAQMVKVAVYPWDAEPLDTLAAGESGARVLAAAGFQPMTITDAVLQEASPLLQSYSVWAASEFATNMHRTRTYAFYQAVNEVVSGYRTRTKPWCSINRS